MFVLFPFVSESLFVTFLRRALFPRERWDHRAAAAAAWLALTSVMPLLYCRAVIKAARLQQ
jgi:hypothetical protein